MSIRAALASALLSVVLIAPAWAHDPAAPQQAAAPEQSVAGTDAPVCTDLSGKVRVPCPGDDAKKSKAASSRVSPDAKSEAPAPAVAGEPIHVFKPAPVPQEQPPIRAESAGEPIHVFKPAAQPSVQAAGGDQGAAGPAADAEPASSPASIASTPPAPRSLERSLPLNLVRDQKSIWTSPLRVRLQDVQWLAPLVGAVTVAVAADRSIEKELPTSASFIKHSNDFSNYSAAAFAGITAGGYLWGRMTGNEHLRETAVLSGEAAINTFALTYAIKAITHRDRPLEGDGTGRFWSNGDSFPSEHAAAAWSMASVIAREYPGPLPTLLAYGGATAITAARVTARKHFTSDVLVGSALGWFIGREVYRSHHNREDMAKFGTFERAPARESPRDTANMGSPYVPLDSWVYPAIDRLAALGYIQTAFTGLRPWTRMECARLVDEAAVRAQSQADDNQAASLLRPLQAEFAFEAERAGGAPNVGAQVESIYTRVTGISGKPLTDGYHFGQTIVNDYGRPYQEGANLISGFSARAEAGPLAFYVRGEYQHAPAAPALPLPARAAMAFADSSMFSGFELLPLPPGTPAPARDDFRLLDTYVAYTIQNTQISFGRQSLWWGPGEGGPMLFSDNIAPIDMLRFDRVKPFTLPSILGLLGPIRTQFFLGRLAGYEFIFGPSGLAGEYGRALASQPFIHGQKLSFKPSPNFEFSISRTTIYGGTGYPFTTHTFLRSLFSLNDAAAGAVNKQGDRRSGFDFTYRIPKLRNWLTFYADGFVEDQYSPIAYPDRAVWHAGIYVPQLPRLHKLDFRAEGVYSDNPIGGAVGPGYYYFNSTWRSGYQSNGDLIGNWIGRAGQGAQAWTTYHFDPKNFVQLSFRHQKVSREFLVGGGTLTDFAARSDFWVRPTMSLSGVIQYEKWVFPTLATGPQSNIGASVQFSFWPRGWSKR